MICKHCNNPKEDCDKRARIWQEQGLVVSCIGHHSENRKSIELTSPIICGKLGCNEKGVYLEEP